jgi:hypothetical protein
MAIICGALAPIGFMCEALLLGWLLCLVWSGLVWSGLVSYRIVTPFLVLSIVHVLVTLFLVHVLYSIGRAEALHVLFALSCSYCYCTPC